MSNKNKYVVAGLMSGTSLDGLDIALCKFTFEKKWSFEILAAKTFDYHVDWKKILSEAHLCSGIELTQLHIEIGKLHGDWTKSFLVSSNIKTDFISSHGHTIFHQPEKSLTLQIGSAPHIAAATNLPVVADFRTTDVALGGQGAPLVPIGDLMLFPEYKYCLNLGGIANISIKSDDGKSIRAFDVCPCNMMLNHVVSTLGVEYDDGGKIASTGVVDESLLASLNQISFYQKPFPKSLGKEFFDADIFPLIQNSSASIENILRTMVEHIASQISNVLSADDEKMLVTGGGAFNSFLMKRICALSNAEVIIPSPEIIQFKEALIFAFLGLLRIREENNCLASVTGAERDSCGGAVYL